MTDPGDTQDGTPEVTEAEVEAAARALYEDHRTYEPGTRLRFNFVAFTPWPEVVSGGKVEWREKARAALKAAYAVRDTQDGTERLMNERNVEYAAAALYHRMHPGRQWHERSDAVRDEFRHHAIAMLRVVRVVPPQDGTEREGGGAMENFSLIASLRAALGRAEAERDTLQSEVEILRGEGRTFATGAEAVAWLQDDAEARAERYEKALRQIAKPTVKVHTAEWCACIAAAALEEGE